MNNNSLFNAENWLWQPFSWVTDFLILSAMWLFCCIPVVTAGAATAALYDCCARCLRGGEREMFSRYVRTFRRELGLSIPTFALWAVILAGGFFLIRRFTGWAEGTDFNVALAYGLTVLLCILAAITSWVFPLQSRFTFDFAGLNGTALRLAIAHLPRTIALGVVNLAAGWLCLRFLLPVMVVPGIAGVLSTFILEPVFKTYENPENT